MAPTGPPHSTLWQDVAKGLDAGPEGLSSEEAARRLRQYGPNELPQERPPSAWRVLGRQFANILIWILLFAIGLSAFLGDVIEAIAISLITVFTVVLGFVQEQRAEHAMDALRRMTAPDAHVVRDGQTIKVASPEVVPGDVVVLAPGDVVPADARLVEAADLQAAEAALTGESLPVDKGADATIARDAALGDRSTMVYAATTVTRGRARALVTATGKETEVGKIGQLLGEVESAKTPLERQLAHLGRWLLIAGGLVIALIVVLGIVRGEPWPDMLVFGVALAVAAVPEALPAVVTISLAIGAQRMAKRNALVRRLPTVETLGSTTIICSDKTGTLTTGDMTAHSIILADRVIDATALPKDDAAHDILRAAALCNDAEVRDGGEHGDPTETALLHLARTGGFERAALERQWPRVDEEPFSSETQRMITTHQAGTGRLSYAKGSASAILDLCDAAGPLRDEAGRQMQEAAERGMRVLAFAQDDGAGFRWLGLVALRDPPREEAKQAVQTCIDAGIKPVLITGDHPATAKAIAAELGFPDTTVATGPEVQAMDEGDLRRTVHDAGVYARVSPEHKLRIVQALQADGQIVAMTGDGVNDAPALRQADIGVAMGITGTDVAKQAAAMTLADDDFASIVSAVEEGRGIFDNIRKYLIYLLSTNLGEIILIAAAMLFGLPLPLTAVMVLYVNLASDGLPALALAVDPHEPDLMRRPPRRPGGGILDAPVITLMVIGGVWTAAATIAVFILDGATESSRTSALATLVLLQFVMGYSFRTERRGIWQKPFANKWYNLAILWEITLLSLLVYVPALNRLFGTTPMAAADWTLVLVAVLTVVPVLETVKWLGRR